MPSPSLAEAVLSMVGDLESYFQTMAKRIPGATPPELFIAMRTLGRLDQIAKTRVSESTYEAHRRTRLEAHPTSLIDHLGD